MNNNLHPVVLSLLLKRGITNDKIDDFLSKDLNYVMPFLLSLKDLDKAANRIIKAIQCNEKIAIYGDYDVDGTTSCSLFYHFFKMINVSVFLIQPSRFIEGYGLHVSSIDDCIAQNVDVIITVDCGITSNDAAVYAKSKNIDLIITDHHKDGLPEMPPAYAIVNPNRRDEENSEAKALAGVGVAFAVCVKVREILLENKMNVPSLYPLLSLVAIGTICDVAYLNLLNIKLVRHGLEGIVKSPYPGLKVFLNPDEIKVSSEKLAFHIGPIINSKGRLDHPEMALNLLNADSKEEARIIYDKLIYTNNERKFIQSTVFNEAKEDIMREVASLYDDEHFISIAYRPHWNEGVIGIVASKLVETFKVPALVFTDTEHAGIIKASARSAGELDLFEMLKSCEELFIKFGGHKKAAGLSMKKENLAELSRRLKSLLKNIPAIIRTKSDYYDLEIEAEDINPKLMRDLDLIGPFGNGNESPLFKISNVSLESFDILKDVHVRWSLRKNKVRMKGISFNYMGKFNSYKPQELMTRQNLNPNALSVHCSLAVNKFNGNESIQLMVEKFD